MPYPMDWKGAVRQLIIYNSSSGSRATLREACIQEEFQVYFHNGDAIAILTEVIRERPPVILLCVDSIRPDTISLVNDIRKYCPVTHVILQAPLEIILSLNIETVNVSGVLLFDSGITEMVACLKAVYEGARYLPMRIVRKDAQMDQAVFRLTKQEARIIGLIAQGTLKNKELAILLFVSVHTIKNHKDHLVKKLNLGSVNDLYIFARNCLVSIG